MVLVRKTVDYLLHLNAMDETLHYAQNLRKSTTEAERILWNELKGRKLKGLKFRRQHPIHFYIADFYCHEKRLVIEIDGGIHEKSNIKEHDENRTAELERLGITVIRFSNEEVINTKELGLRRLIELIEKYYPPSPSGEGARG